MEPTVKQLEFITFLENETGVVFTGTSKAEASRYIQEQKNMLPPSSTENMWSLINGY